MYNACVKIALPTEGLAQRFRETSRALGQKKPMKKHQINLPPAVSIALMLHVPWKEVWDVVSFHCVFSQHLSRFSENVTSFTLTVTFIKMLLLFTLAIAFIKAP